MNALIIKRAGPAVSIQDMGRNGYRANGLSKGGALDIDAHLAGAAILGQDQNCASLEMIGFGGEFEVLSPTIFTVTGAAMRLELEGKPLETYVSYEIHPNQRLKIGSALSGQVAYLHIFGGIQTETILGSRSFNSAAGIGTPLKAGSKLPLGEATARAGKTIQVKRETPRKIGVLPTAQTHQFSTELRDRFEQTPFTFEPMNFGRQGVELIFEGKKFSSTAHSKNISDAISPGDIQIVGAGVPYVLLAESQTIGGYPRIASILPSELPKFVQAPKDTLVYFQFLDYQEAAAKMQAWREAHSHLNQHVTDKIRDPRYMPDLLSYTLIGGVISGYEEL